MGSTSESEAFLPTPQLSNISSGISLLEPLSRRGSGHGIILLIDGPTGAEHTTAISNGVPSAAMKWAEEGYTVVEIRGTAFENIKDPVECAINALEKCDACEPKEKFGLVAYDPSLWNKAASSLQFPPKVVGAVIYSDANTLPSLKSSPVPSVHHLAGTIAEDLKLKRSKQLSQYYYPNSTSFAFATPPISNTSGPEKALPGYHYANETVSHTRNLSFLKNLMDGPWFDLEAIWDEHTYFEFSARDTRATMATMVQEPYVNHIPTITGGIGRVPLNHFYENHFIFNNPAGTELELISRTVGIDRVVDEFVFKFKHDRVIDWLLPGVPPTNRYAEIPFTAIVNIRGDRLYHEHIAWDQATALRQLGLLPEYLPWPEELPLQLGKENGVNVDLKGTHKYEYRVPATGAETAEKMRDKNSVQSNLMFEFGIREVKK